MRRLEQVAQSFVDARRVRFAPFENASMRQRVAFHEPGDVRVKPDLHCPTLGRLDI